jgi:hypothetical protein
MFAVLSTANIKQISSAHFAPGLFMSRIIFNVFREAGKNTFNIALVTENVTLSNPGI